MRPVSAAAVGPLHDSPFDSRLHIRGLALDGRHASSLGGRWGLLHICRLYLEYFVQRLRLTWRYCSGLPQMLQWLHLLSLILHVSTRWYKI